MPTFIQEVALPTSPNGVFNTVDLSPYIPATAAVVFLKFRNNAGFSYTMMSRAPGSSDMLSQFPGGEAAGMRDYGLCWQCCKVIGQQIELYNQSPGPTISLFGYLTNDEVAAQTNVASTFVLSTVFNTWQTIDITSLIPAGVGKVYGILLQNMTGVPNDGGMSPFGIRPTGSNYTLPIQSQSQQNIGFATVAIDANNTFQLYTSSGGTHDHFNIVGFILKDIIKMYTVPVDVTPAVVGVAQDGGTFPSDALGGIYEVQSTGNEYYNLYASGDPYDTLGVVPLGYAYTQPMVGIVPLGANRRVTGLKGSTGVKLYELGYWRKPPGASGLFFGTNF